MEPRPPQDHNTPSGEQESDIRESLRTILGYIEQELAIAGAKDEFNPAASTMPAVRETSCKLANGDSISIYGSSLEPTEDNPYGVDYKEIGLTHRRKQYNLQIYSKVTDDGISEEGREYVFNGKRPDGLLEGPEDNLMLPLDQAIVHPVFKELISLLNHTITVEVPKPPRVFRRRELSRSVIYPEGQEGGTSESAVGYAELARDDHGALLMDNDQRLYGVFDTSCNILYALRPIDGARLSAEIIQEYMNEQKQAPDPDSQRKLLVDALWECIVEIRATDNAGRDVSATTATVAQIYSFEGVNYLVWASVGDSRLYVQAPDGTLTQISTDELTGSFEHNYLAARSNGVNQSDWQELPQGSAVILMTKGVAGEHDTNRMLSAMNAQNRENPFKKLLSYVGILRQQGGDVKKNDGAQTTGEWHDTAQMTAQRLLSVSGRNGYKAVVVVRS